MTTDPEPILNLLKEQVEAVGKTLSKIQSDIWEGVELESGHVDAQGNCDCLKPSDVQLDAVRWASELPNGESTPQKAWMKGASEASAYQQDANERVFTALQDLDAAEAEYDPEEAVKALTQQLTHLFGLSCWDDSAHRTAERVLAAWQEYVPPAKLPFTFTTFPTNINQLVIVKDIEFSSLCAHHLFPWYGVAHVGYVPNELAVGVSKIPRLVNFWAKRPSTQEYVTSQIASDMKHRLSAMGVAVVIEARHTCMACRGVKAHSASMITSEMRGIFLTSGEARAEFLSLIGRDRI